MKTVAVALAFATALTAQSPPCLSFNDATNSNTGALTAFSFAGPNGRAYAFTPASAITVQAVRMFTGNTLLSGAKFLTVQICADATNVPGTVLATGTWRISASLGQSWQGAGFDHAVSLASGTQYWVTLIDPGFTNIPEEAAGGQVLTLATRSGTTWTRTGTASPKIRLYCSALDDLYVTPYGPSCAGSNGASPSAFTNQTPTIGNTNFAVEGCGFLPGTVTVAVFGVIPGFPSSPLPGTLPTGCYLNTDVSEVFFGSAGTGTVAGPSASGHTYFPLPVPADPSLSGAYAAIQLAGVDLSFPVSLPLVTTNALQFLVL